MSLNFELKMLIIFLHIFVLSIIYQMITPCGTQHSIQNLGWNNFVAMIQENVDKPRAECLMLDLFRLVMLHGDITYSYS